MGEAKRRKQLLGDVYGSRVNLEKCPIPSEISLGYVSDEALATTKCQLHRMPEDFKSTFFIALTKAKTIVEPGIVFSEALKFSGGVGVEVTFRSDIETFIKSRCNTPVLGTTKTKAQKYRLQYSSSNSSPWWLRYSHAPD